MRLRESARAWLASEREGARNVYCGSLEKCERDQSLCMGTRGRQKDFSFSRVSGQISGISLRQSAVSATVGKEFHTNYPDGFFEDHSVIVQNSARVLCLLCGEIRQSGLGIFFFAGKMMPIREDDLDSCNNNGGNSGLSGTMSGNSAHDGRDNRQGGSGVTPTPPMTKAEMRKSNKPIMEKKRRARINNCLNELKTLILEAMKKDPARHTKLEKADILEMTVKHLQTIQRQQFALAVNTDPTVVHKFKTGFTDCAEEVTRYVSQMDGIDSGVKQRLANHLNNCVTNIQQLTPSISFPATSSVGLSAFPGLPLHGASTAGSSILPLPQDVNNNGRIQMGGVQLIPSRLPTGELALVMPNSSNLSFFPGTSPFSTPAPPPPNGLDLGASAYTRSSAFSSVRPPQARHSPPLSPVSSISSCGEDSHHSSDYHNSTASPPLMPSSSAAAAITSNLQQPQVSSTTELQKARLEPRPEIQYVNKKRPYPFDVSEGAKYEVSAKAIKLEAREQQPSPNLDHNQNSAQNGNASADMWRPW
ncbi:protein deadpan [Phlebotomus argentipes]|uniref:protein deadpan n=1 Tax=Phlebotomus argentipes TaxID=94469 RepID=UPI002892EB2F|nr:protein deadpan [Phlebotomus argentipes]XP_059622749.1 protein deadpan [Phlebotomus argentipes]